jgi:biotin carboxyl carrier protein
VDGIAAPEDLDSLTDELVPALITRLRASRLGEIEVGGDGWRVRLRRDPTAPGRRSGSAASGRAAEVDDLRRVATSPAVGYFKPAPGLSVGHTIQAGDVLGSVDVLGITQEVIAPSDGVISHVLAEGGQAVEYGQTLAEIDPLDIDTAAVSDETAGTAA